MEIYAFGGLSNHAHWLVGAADVDQLAGFMGYVKSNLAREAGRIVDWSEKFWGRRYRAIEISPRSRSAWIDRLRYVLSHGPKENLVLRCRDWPGLQCIDALTDAQASRGLLAVTAASSTRLAVAVANRSIPRPSSSTTPSSSTRCLAGDIYPKRRLGGVSPRWSTT